MTERIGDWVIEAPIGSGGMGTVYRCHNVLTPRIKAAVKIIRPDKPEAFRERFLREVESLEALHHHAIVRVKGWGEQDGMLWLAMDLVEGTDLEDLLGRDILQPDHARRVFSDVASGLAHAHERNVAHRDVKPANILILPDGGGRIVDFGIAVQDGRTRLTAAGSMSGTPAYMAPEVFGGTPEGTMLDIYALGQALYEALTGAVAFPQPEGLTTTQQLAHVVGLKMQAEPLDPGPDFPDDLREVIRRATQPQPERRIPTMRMFADALEGGKLPPMQGASDTLHLDLGDVSDEDPDEVPVVAPPPPPPRRRGGGFITGALGAAVVLLLGVVALTAVGAAAAWFMWPAGGNDFRVSLSGIAPGTPTAVWVGRKRAEPEIGGTIWHRDDTPNGPQTVRVITGEACDVDAWDGEACLPCCSCETVVAQADAIVPIVMTPPSETATVRLVSNDLPDPWSLSASSDTLTLTEAGRGEWRATGLAGEHTLRVDAGVCRDEWAGCGDDCPAGCSSQTVSVVLACGETVDASVTLAAPRRPVDAVYVPPAAPVPGPSPSVTPTPAPAPVPTPAPTPSPEPTLDIDKPGMSATAAPAPAPMARPTPAPEPMTRPGPRWGSGAPAVRIPGFTPTTGTLNGVSVLVRHRAAESEQAAIAVSRLSRRGATVRSEPYERPGSTGMYGHLYYRNADYTSSAVLASSTLREVASTSRMMRDLGTGDDIVIYLEPREDR